MRLTDRQTLGCFGLFHNAHDECCLMLPWIFIAGSDSSENAARELAFFFPTYVCPRSRRRKRKVCVAMT